MQLGINKNLSQEMSQKLSIANASKPSQMPVESGGLQYAPADVCRPASAHELQQIDDIRNLIQPSTTKATEAESPISLDDGTILRWLRSKGGRFDEAAEGLKKMIVFRKAWKMDEALDDKWAKPEVLELLTKYCGYGFLSDKSGNPVLMSLLGNCDVSGILRSIQSKDYIKFSLTAIEKGIKLCQESAFLVGRPFEQMMLVFDLDNISSEHFTSFAKTFTTLVLLFQEHYPLVLHKILIIRAPEMARIAFSALQPFLSDSIQKLIEIPGEGWKLVLGDYVDLDSWPVYWGGRMTEDGDPKCPSKIRFGLGPVPEEFFIDPTICFAKLDCDQETTVYAGDKHLIELRGNVNTRINWQYMTKEEDIGFAVYYDAHGAATNLLEMECVHPYMRLECSNVPISGSIICDKSGRYIIEFDNYYSWFSAKQLKYNIEIE